MMRVAGVITCHNHVGSVGVAMDSFYSQDYEDKRLVVFDDESSAESRSSIDEAVRRKTCPTTVVRSEGCVGVSAARNACIRHAWDDADAFAFLDDDDVYDKHKVGKSVALMSTDYGRVGIVYADERVFDEVSGISYVRYKPSFSLERLLGRDVIGGNIVVSKSAFNSRGVFDESMRVGEIYDLAVRVVATHVIIHVPDVLEDTRITRSCLRKTVGREEWARNEERVRGNAGS